MFFNFFLKQAIYSWAWTYAFPHTPQSSKASKLKGALNYDIISMKDQKSLHMLIHMQGWN